MGAWSILSHEKGAILIVRLRELQVTKMVVSPLFMPPAGGDGISDSILVSAANEFTNLT